MIIKHGVNKKFRINANSRIQIRILRREQNNSRDKVYYLEPNITRKNTMVAIEKLIVIFRPKKLKPDIQTIKKYNELQIFNQGNTTIKLSEISQCKNREDQCIKIDFSNPLIFPGDSYIIALENKNNMNKILLSKEVLNQSQKIYV